MCGNIIFDKHGEKCYVCYLRRCSFTWEAPGTFFTFLQFTDCIPLIVSNFGQLPLCAFIVEMRTMLLCSEVKQVMFSCVRPPTDNSYRMLELIP